MSKKVLNLNELTRDEVPTLLRAESYFDFHTHPFEHQPLFDEGDMGSEPH